MHRLVTSIRIPLLIASIFWVIELSKYIGIDLTDHGILPRSKDGLIGILASPFLHGNFAHPTSNTPTFIVLCASILFFYKKIAFEVIAWIWIFTGVAVWLLARPVYHIGASGVIYGFAGFLFFSGVFRKNIGALVLSLAIAFLYGGMLYGILPNQPGISWESHLLGGLVGGYVAFQFKDKAADDEEEDNQLPPGDFNPEGYKNIENNKLKYIFRPRK